MNVSILKKWDDKYIDSLLGDHAVEYKQIQDEHDKVKRGHEQKMKQFQDEIDRNNMLLLNTKKIEIDKQTENEKFNEKEYKSWTCNQVISWIEYIEDGLFGIKTNKDPTIKGFKENLSSNDICGKNLNSLNDLSLKILGINKDLHRKLILNNIDRLLSNKQNR